MKRILATMANRLFGPFGFKLVGSKAVEFTMNSMLARLRLGSWNATRFPFARSVFWHFHGLRLYLDWRGRFRAEFGPYPLPVPVRRQVYQPYLDDLRAAMESMTRHGLIVRPQSWGGAVRRFRTKLGGIYRQLWRFHAPLTARL